MLLTEAPREIKLFIDVWQTATQNTASMALIGRFCHFHFIDFSDSLVQLKFLNGQHHCRKSKLPRRTLNPFVNETKSRSVVNSRVWCGSLLLSKSSGKLTPCRDSWINQLMFSFIVHIPSTSSFPKLFLCVSIQNRVEQLLSLFDLLDTSAGLAKRVYCLIRKPNDFHVSLH